jgi:hypothetical protein
MEFLKLKLVEYGMAFVIAPLAVVVMQMLKRYSAWVDAQNAWVKRAFVLVTVFAFTVLAHRTGLNFGVIGEDLSFLGTLDQATIETVLGAAAAYLLHALQKARTKA